MTTLGLVELDMSAEDEAGVVDRLDHEIPALALAGASHVVLDLGDLPFHRATADAVTPAHGELRAVGGRLVVVTTPPGARLCARVCPEMLVTATLRQAHAALALSVA
jgi:hypothetical protein